MPSTPRHLALLALLALAVLGCGSDEPSRSESAPAPEPPAATEAPADEEGHGFEPGHSQAVRDYYGVPHSHEDDGVGDTEAEYHQPPRPATGRIGDPITLTGSNLGVRMQVTVTGVVDPVAGVSRPARAGRRHLGIGLRVRNTGVAIFESDLRAAVLTYGAGRRARAVTGVESACSNGFEGVLRIEPEAGARGCLLFALPRGAKPRQLQLALEQVPAEAGGKWRLR